VRGCVRALVVPLLLAAHAWPVLGQSWNSAEALTLVRRAVDRREAAQADSSLASYRTKAHGFVFFLAQVGEGLTEPPRLVKADELDVEVYWQAPNRSKQVILGWRDGAFLPSDINYHRDHLGIVTNNFGDLIRIGEGDEVRDVIHPLAPAGLEAYDYALGDSLTIRSAEGRTVVREVQVRPRSFKLPLVVGTLFLDASTAQLVRFRFSFTPPAYLDRQLEDISIVLENALYENRYWLPYRQEMEIRRRSTWLDFPARGIIRGRWEIDGYDLNLKIPPRVLAGAPIGGLLQPRPDDSTWAEPLQQAIAGVARPLNDQDMAALRMEVERIAGARALDGLSSRRLAAGSISDLAHVNRVQGLALGAGALFDIGGSRAQLHPSIGYGTGDGRVLGGLSATVGQGATQLNLEASRSIRDLSDLPVISPAMNSILSQESGDDHGDYVLLNSVGFGVRHRLSGRTTLGLGVGIEESQSVGVSASPAGGEYRPNPPLGSGTRHLARIDLERASGGIAVRRDLQGRLSLEGGEGRNGVSDYLRATGEGRWLVSLGKTELLSRAYFGLGTDGLPPHRTFVMGGRGTLLGEPFRAYGGRTAALAHVEWRFQVPVPAIPLGSFASTGHWMTVAPFLSAGYTDRPIVGLPWTATDGVRPVSGVALEWFMRLVRLEAGIGLRDGRFGVTIDVNRDWWGLL
jgi:hypothetical protein